jgi:hypothetical protein
LARKKGIDGLARKIVESVDASLEPSLVMRRFSKVCAMLNDPRRAEQAFVEHDKGELLSRARRKLHVS